MAMVMTPGVLDGYGYRAQLRLGFTIGFLNRSDVGYIQRQSDHIGAGLLSQCLGRADVSFSIAAMATFAPSSAKRLAMPRPIPLLPPGDGKPVACETSHGFSSICATAKTDRRIRP